MSGGGRQNWNNMQGLFVATYLTTQNRTRNPRHSAIAVEDYLTERLKAINDLDYEAINDHGGLH